MVVAFDMHLGYMLWSIGYITLGYGFMLFIIFGYSCYVVLKTMWYSFSVVLCDI